MRKWTWLFLASFFVVAAALHAQDVKPVSPLASETDLAKIQALIISTDYKVITEDDYVAIMKNLIAVAKSVDISNADGKKKGGLIDMLTYVFGKRAKDLKAFMDADGICIVDNNWLDSKATSTAGSLKKMTNDQWIKRIDDKYTSDEAKMRADFQAAKAAVK